MALLFSLNVVCIRESKLKRRIHEALCYTCKNVLTNLTITSESIVCCGIQFFSKDKYKRNFNLLLKVLKAEKKE